MNIRFKYEKFVINEGLRFLNYGNAQKVEKMSSKSNLKIKRSKKLISLFQRNCEHVLGFSNLQVEILKHSILSVFHYTGDG